MARSINGPINDQGPLDDQGGQFWFDEAAADLAVNWIETHCRFTEDRWAGKLFRLEAWQRDEIIRPLFGWKRTSDDTRRFRRCVVWVPRKNGKTELAAAVSLLMLMPAGVAGGQVYAIAKDVKQAHLVFDKAVRMVATSKPLGKMAEVFKTSIFVSRLPASFKPLSGRPEGKHGLSMSGLIGDEAHEWPDSRLYTFVHQSSANRAEPIEFIISTAGVRTGYGWELWNECLKIRDGVSSDNETLVVIHAAAADDDWTDPATWRKANPNLGVSVSETYLAAECERAKENPRLENDFKRYHLNQWTEQAVRWLQMHAWRASPADPDPERWRKLPAMMAGRSAYAGLDLSATTDMTAWVLVFPPDDDWPQWIWLPRIFVPEGRIDEKVRHDHVPVDRWIADGAMIKTPGNVTDYRVIKEQIYRDAETFKLEKAGVDRWNATQLVVELQDEGLPVELVGQGYGSLNAPAKELERQVAGALIDHGQHPVLDWMAGNVAVTVNPAGDIKPVKDKSTGRIDGIAAGVTGLAVALARDEDEKKPVEIPADYRMSA